MTAYAAYRSIVSSRLTWMRANLFSSWGNSALSLTAIGVGCIAVYLILKFVLFQANWGLVAINRKLFFIGSYPSDEVFRIWISVFVVAALIALTYGIWMGRLRPYVAAIGIAAVITPYSWLGDGAAHRGTALYRGDTVRR